MTPIGAVPWAGLVFDEAHYLKNHTSARSKVAREIASGAAAVAKKEPPVYLLTGTPLTNRPRDLFRPAAARRASAWAQFSLVRQTLLRRYEDRVRVEDRWRIATGGTHGAAARDDAAARQGGSSLPPKLRTWLPTTDAAGIAKARNA